MWEKLAAAAGVRAVERFFGSLNKQEEGTIGIGLAVGYFYNFLAPVSGAIRSGQIEISSSATDPSPRKFRSEDVRVQVITPARLDVHSFERCETEFKATHKGQLFLAENARFYGVNYTLMESPDRVELVIIDLARPVMAIKRYYEEILKRDTHHDKDGKWTKSQIAELTAFKETIKELQLRGYGALVNKLDFRERA